MVQFFRFLLFKKDGKKVTVGYVTIMNDDLFADILRQEIYSAPGH